MTGLDTVRTDAVTAGPHHARGYRYPGSPPFADSDLDRLVFRGRAAEKDAVLHSILSFDLYVIFGASGAGKTSLLNAGVFDALRARDLWPFVLRLNDPTSKPIDLIASELEASALSSQKIDLTRHPSTADAKPRTLWGLLSALEVWRGNVLQKPVLVFDQFEELFTLDFTDEDRRDFIVDLGEVVRRHRIPDRQQTPPSLAQRLPAPDVKIVLALREDSLGELEALSTHIPQIMRNRFRLQGLKLEQAKRAIVDPAAADDPRLKSQRFTYTERAADLLLEFLRTRHVRGEAQLAASVDPSQLQIICQHVERTILPRKTRDAGDHTVEITPEDLGGPEGLNAILLDFYRREIDALDPEDQDKARALCEAGLISRNGRRLSLEEGEIQADYGVSTRLLGELIDRRLLRAEPRVGSVYYELAHDTLVASILDHRRDWMTLQEQERRAHERAVRLDRWAIGLTLPGLLLFGFLSGPLMAIALIALRSPPRRRKGRWRPKVALAIGLCWQALYAFGSFVPEFYDGEPWLTRWMLYAMLTAQPTLGAAVGLAWPIKSKLTSEPKRRGRWEWVVGIASATFVVAGLVALLLAAPPLPAGAKPSDQDLPSVESSAAPIDVGARSFDDGPVSVSVPESGAVQQELQVANQRTVTISVTGVDNFDSVLAVLEDDGAEIARDDDGGGYPNPRIELDLAPGTYILEVFGYEGSAGQATIEVVSDASKPPS